MSEGDRTTHPAGERFFRPAPAPPLPEEPADRWKRLSSRVVWVDLVQVVVALLPAGIAFAIGIDPEGGGLWPLLGIAVFGVLGAVIDATRWLFTRYRVTETHVELRTGVLFRVHRSIQRDRIRSVDAEAKLRHRLAALRVLEIGAGQQSAARESALKLDALGRADAYALRHELLDPDARAAAEDAIGEDADDVEGRVAAPDTAGSREPLADAEPDADEQPIAVFWRFDPRWVVFHVLSVWSYVVVLGIGWGANFFLGTFGIDLVEVVSGLLDWDAIGTAGTVAIGFVAATIGGMLALAVAFFTEYWGYELARVRGRTTTDPEAGSKEGTLLRTRRGLFTTREVNRAEHRIRGVRLSEPLLWRWIGATDTTVITTGLSLWAIDQPTAILPRGPIAVHRRIAAEVLDPDHAPLAADLATHPRAALRRRLWWATLLTLTVAAILVWLLVTDVVPAVALAGLAILWPLALVGGLVAYRALGHAIVGPYLVARSGLTSRATTVLRRDAVSTIVVRESLFQRRLGLRTVATMTAAGAGRYQVPDLTRDDALRFAADAAPGLLDPFLEM
ncbi:MAG: PH domain-containing protein [Patulibacter sp.]|nr:PH domain-containing protein [Patulibacter sp.]